MKGTPVSSLTPSIRTSRYVHFSRWNTTQHQAMTSQQQFGGSWSDKKLATLRKYLPAYTKVLSKTSFKTAYIDAFAGAGKQSDDDESAEFRHGSPLIALQTKPAFDTFIFIERDPKKLGNLRTQIRERKSLQRDIRYMQGDANEKLTELCSKPRQWDRAVVFLDPFALQVEWATIRRIAETKVIDMWLLFPAMAGNRMLPLSGEIPESWAEKLNRTFGSKSWKDVFYAREGPDLWGEELISKTSKPFDTLSDFVTERLNSEFAAVNNQPLVLSNSTGSPMFLLYFACGNKRGAKPALRIANYIIKSNT